MITDPSEADNNAFICLSPTIEDFNNFKFSITNLGSGFPEPKGESELISEKKSIFSADGEIFESKKRMLSFFIFFLTLKNLLFIKV